MQKCKPLPGFFANNTNKAAGEELAQIKPLSTISLMYVFNTFNLSADIEYKRPHVGVLSFISSMEWL